MAISQSERNEIISLVVGAFDAAPGNANLTELVAAYESGSTMADLADHLVATSEFVELYPSYLTNEEFVTNYVTNTVGGRVDQGEMEDIIDVLIAEMNNGASRANVVHTAVLELSGMPESDPVWGDAAAAFNNKVDVATYYTVTAGKDGDLADLQGAVAGVDETQQSVDDAIAAIDNGGNAGGAQFLTAGQDVLTGTGADDLFIADVLQNADGRQVNSLGTGDRLNGAGGIDSLEAQVTRGATFGGESNMAIQARTTSVENIFLEALNADLQTGQNTDVYVNAMNMTAVEQLWSDHSNGNLVIQDLTTKTDAGEKRLTSDITIGMRQTGNANSAWEQSDMKVYFDQNYLLADVESETTASQANYWLLDQDSENYIDEPLAAIDRDGIIFSLDGTQFIIRPDNEAILEAATWEEYAQFLRDEIAEMVADGATALAGIEVIVDPTNINQTYNDDGELVTIPAITLSDSNGGVFSGLGYTIPEGLSDGFNVYGRFDTEAPVTSTTEAVVSNIVLEKVGRGGDGGELVVGGMDKGNDDNTYNGKTGVEQFNVSVVGDEALPNSLSGLRSTNNALQVVNINSVDNGDTSASLTIGNSHTAGYGLKDVRFLNAVEFDGDLSVNAGITTESIAKYFDVNDAQGDAAADDIYFDYSLTGSGNNTLDLAVAQEVASHDDFVLTVLSGEGNDNITVSLFDDATNATLNQNWYANQSALANASISTGAGDDVIRTPGSGDIIIDAGAGNDTVYTDNTGSQTIVNSGFDALIPNGTEVMAHWVTNAENTNIHDLEGSGTGASQFLYGASLTVTLSGASVNGAGGVTTGAADSTENGFESTVTIPTGNGFVGNATHINQAIKDAINNDPVLSKLLVAKDGPNFSLVIESLIDGEFEASDLEITMTGPSAAAITALSAGQLTNVANAYGDFINDSDFAPGTAANFAAIIGGQVSTAAGNYQGVNGSSLATDGEFTPAVVAEAEVQTIDFTGFGVITTGDFTVGGVTVNVTAGDTDADIATAVAAAITGGLLANSTNPVTAVATGAEVEITYDITDANVTEVVVAPGTAVVEDNLVPVAEEQTLDFALASAASNGNFSVGGILVNVLASDTPNQIAAKVAAAINADGSMTSPLGTVTAEVDPADLDEVIVTFSVADGDVAPITVLDGSAGIVPADITVTQTEAYDPLGTGDAADIEDAPVATENEGVAAAPATGTGDVISGEDADALTDNTINLGSGDDVLVMSTSIDANETLVFTGLGNGVNTVVNFSDDGAGMDMLDFTDYLTGRTSASGSSDSEVDVAVTLDANSVVTANEVVITDFATLPTATGVTWANLSAATLQAALNDDGTFEVGNTADLVGNSQKAVFMIENGANDGEYKLFEVSMNNPAAAADDGFTVVGLIGVVDFGDSLDNASTAMFAGS